MAASTVSVLDELRKLGVELDPDFLRQAIALVMRLLMDAEVQALIGAERYQRTEERTTYRNGYRERNWQTRVGDVALQIPKLRDGSYFPSFLEPRKRAERALLSVIQQAYIEGVSTRKVDELVQALGLSGIDKSAVSRICQELDTAVTAFRTRPLEGAYPYVWFDALYLKVRQNHRIISMAVVIAIGVKETGERTILDLDIGASEDAAFWTSFLRSLVQRGLRGVELAISDAHLGVQEAIRTVLSGATWQRCRVHTMRNILAQVPHRDKSLVVAAIRTIFAQPTQAEAKRQLVEVVTSLRGRWSKAADVLEGADDDVLAYMAFPQGHWTRIDSTNPLERLNREVKRRTEVVGVFPDTASVLRLVGSVLIEQDDEWAVERRYFSHESMQRRKQVDGSNRTLNATPRLEPIR